MTAAELAFAAVVGSAAAQPLPPPVPLTPPLTPPVLLAGRVERDKFVYGETVHVPFMRMVQGPQPGAPATELVYLIQTRQVAVPLKGATATDAAGKPIPVEKLAEVLKDEAVVVVTYGGELDPKFRKPFKEGTVFLSFPAAPPKEPVVPKEPIP
ncbi:MAG TPA: hypothetical protein VFG68_16660 [Fimbriiglobus sp.]|nr:hypothetical protein [Fimbriiglobus sp.]